MQIQFEIERPLSLTVTILTCIGIFAWLTHVPAKQPLLQAALIPVVQEEMPTNLVAAGGNEVVEAEVVHETEAEISQQRILRTVLERKEEILRYQLNVLDAERKLHGSNISAELDTEFTEANDKLIALLRNKHEAEMQIGTALQQLWNAQIRSTSVVAYAGDLPEIVWPIEPYSGISAGFHDQDYEETFGLRHDAIDIPAAQGSDIAAIAEGTIEKVVDNGYGYSYLIVRHEGMTSLYGHVSGFYVQEGDRIRQGQIIASSGGRPGTMGAGLLSTGPHVHLEIIRDGQRIDPIALLPERSTVVHVSEDER